MQRHKTAKLRGANAVLFFLFWLAALYAGADHPPPPGFVLVVLFALAAAGLVYWRVPIYLAWIANRRSYALVFVVRDGLVAGVAFAALPIASRWWLGGGEPTVAPTMADSPICFAVLGVVGVLNAAAICLVNRPPCGLPQGGNYESVVCDSLLTPDAKPEQAALVHYRTTCYSHKMTLASTGQG